MELESDTIFGLAGHNRSGTLELGMSLSNCKYHTHHLRKPSNIFLCSVHLSKLDPFPYYANPKPMVQHLLGHRNTPAIISKPRFNFLHNLNILSYQSPFPLPCLFSFSITLYHVIDCQLRAASVPRIHSTGEAPSGETKFIASPFRPTWYDHFCHVKSFFPWSRPFSTTPLIPVSHVS